MQLARILLGTGGVKVKTIATFLVWASETLFLTPLAASLDRNPVFGRGSFYLDQKKRRHRSAAAVSSCFNQGVTMFEPELECIEVGPYYSFLESREGEY